MEEILSGYFQLGIKEDGLYLTVYPAKPGFNNATMDDFLYYLDKRRIEGCNIVEAKKAFQVADGPQTVKISETVCHSANEFGVYSISKDGMTVEAEYYPPFEGAQFLTEQEIISDLKSKGVTFGLDMESIQQFLNGREYGKAYIIARGKEPREGHDGKIVYDFNVDLKPKPKMNEDGSVDFHSLENVNHIKQGDVVAHIIPVDYGDEGVSVFGKAIKPRPVKRVLFKHGKNLQISDDNLQLFSTVNGHVMLENDKIFVSNVMELVDVDNSTGNIDYNGNVEIKGNVLAGFSVKATGDVTVNGIVEGAVIHAGGNITLVRGVQGMNKAELIAGGNIVTKFIESAQCVSAGGNIETDTILHSKVTAKGSIIAQGKNGLIVGGDVRSSFLVEAKSIGNEMGTSTVVGAGVDPALKKRVDDLTKEMDKLGGQKIQLNQILQTLRKMQDQLGKLDPEKQEMLQKTMRNLLNIDQQLNKDKKELEESRNQLSEDGNAKVKVNRSIYVGSKLVFGDQYLYLKEKYDYCQFIKKGAEIKCVTL